MSYDDLFARWRWRPIPGCPGRLVLSPAEFSGSPEELLGCSQAITEVRSDQAPDPIRIATFEGGGLISYHQADGRFVHTLNTEQGFERKLKQLGIVLCG